MNNYSRSCTFAPSPDTLADSRPVRNLRFGGRFDAPDDPARIVGHGANHSYTDTGNGRRIRIETDGRGGLVEFDEGPAPRTLYGIPVETARRTRAAVMHIQARTEIDTTKGQRTQMVAAELARSGWITTRHLARVTGLAPIHVSACLQSLRKRNLAIFAIGKNATGNKAYIWSLKEAA